MSSVEYQNKNATEPIYELDVTVTTPDLTDDTIYCSNLTLTNVSEGLNRAPIDAVIELSSHSNFCNTNITDLYRIQLQMIYDRF